MSKSSLRKYIKPIEKLVPDPFLKSQIEHIPGSTVWNVIQFFLLYVRVEVNQNILNLKRWPLAFTLYKAF